MALLDESEIQEGLTQLDGWQLEGSEIKREFTFRDFAESIEFVNKAAELAEAANHHPDISISWNKVTLTLSTHSEGGLTENDFKLAGQINGL